MSNIDQLSIPGNLDVDSTANDNAASDVTPVPGSVIVRKTRKAAKKKAAPAKQAAAKKSVKKASKKAAA